MKPDVQGFFDPETFTISYLVADPASGAAVIIDPVLDYDPASGRTRKHSADRLIEAAKARALKVEWILEIHIHADHLSAAVYIQAQLGGRIGIGAGVRRVQATFARLYNVEAEYAADGWRFDHLFDDGDQFGLGQIPGRVIHTPGHTPACVTFIIGDAAFVGDSIFMPDYGTARCDFPGGDAGELYRSIQKLFALPDATRLFMCHDYLPAGGRADYRWETTVGEEKANNIHVRLGVSEQAFVALRTARDETLPMPRLLLPSVQVNMRAGHLPPAEDNGVSYLKLPINLF